MSPILNMTTKELRQIFTATATWIIVALFAALVAWTLFDLITQYRSPLDAAMLHKQQQMNINLHIIQPYLSLVLSFGLFTIPLITMRSCAEEKRSHSLIHLLSLPINASAIIGGKYLAYLTLIMLLLTLCAIFLVPLFMFSNAYPNSAVVALLGLFLLFAAMGAMGFFVSTLTENSILAGIITYLGIFSFWVIDKFDTVIDLSYLSYNTHTIYLFSGVVRIQDLSYFLLFIGFFLFLATRRIEAERWRG